VLAHRRLLSLIVKTAGRNYLVLEARRAWSEELLKQEIRSARNCLKLGRFS
jgi:hypothetical protein